VTIEDVQMTWPMRDFDLASQLAMYAATAGGLLVVFMAVGGLVLFVKSLFRGGRHRRPSKL
jgi:hypothetical protein